MSFHSFSKYKPSEGQKLKFKNQMDHLKQRPGDYDATSLLAMGQRQNHGRPLTSYHSKVKVKKVAVPPIALDRIDFMIKQQDRQNMFEQQWKEQFENGCRSQLEHDQVERDGDDGVAKKQIQMSKSCTGFFFQKIQDKPMNIIIEDGRKKNDKLEKFKQKLKEFDKAGNPVKDDGVKPAADFFVTKPLTLNDYFNAQDAITNLDNDNQGQKEELIEDLGSLFDEEEPLQESQL